jgi:hypothetical protein
MIAWTMDPDIFGMPDYGMDVTTSRTFTATLGDVGRGRYIAYNPTGPMPTNITFGWHGDVLAQFREIWEDSKVLNFGANWFHMTLPVSLARGDIGGGVYAVHIVQPFSTSLAGLNWWKVSMTLDIDASPALVA